MSSTQETSLKLKHVGFKASSKTFIYAIESGTPEDIAAYKEHKGDFYREDNGKALYFTTKFVGKKADLVLSDKGNYFPRNLVWEQLVAATESLGGDINALVLKELSNE